MGYRYIVCHPLTRQRLAPPLRLVNPQWTEVVNGIGSFTAEVTIPSTSQFSDGDALQAAKDELRSAFAVGQSALYVLSEESGEYPFAGVIIQADWDRGKNSLAITAVDWSSWLYGVFLGPKLDLTGDNTYGWTNTDQLTIARGIVTYATTGGITDGRPAITLGAETSGKNRDLNITGLAFKYAGELLDTISRRSGGFEWKITAYTDNADNLPRLRFTTGFPEIGIFQSGIMLKSTLSGVGNNMNVKMPVTQSSAEQATRVWATGTNSADTLPFSADASPNLALSAVLLSEKMTNYSTVSDRATLASHARAERQFREPLLNTLNVDIPTTTLAAHSYKAGDRLRLLYSDEWLAFDLPAVRIIQRTVKPNEGVGIVECVLDLTDFEMPDVDTGVTSA